MTYQLFIHIYQLAFQLSGFFSKKARKRLNGIRHTTFPQKKAPRVWFHCASAGEYEQCIPLINKIQETIQVEICISFFSPSGMEYYKQKPEANFAFHLPFDTINNAKALLSSLQADYVIWVKYEFWKNILDEITLQRTPCDLLFVNLLHVENKSLLERAFIIKMLTRNFNHIYSTTPSSIQNIKYQLIHDGKWEKALLNAQEFFHDEIVSLFIKPDRPTIVLGSAHDSDIQLVQKLITSQETLSCNWIIVPHEVDSRTIRKAQKTIPNSMLYDELQSKHNQSQVLIVNKTGILKYLYRYADVAWIGGAFDTSIHNTLEAAAYNIPLVSGPNIGNSPETHELIQHEILFACKDYNQLKDALDKALQLNQDEFKEKTALLFAEKSKDNYSNSIIKNIQQELLLRN